MTERGAQSLSRDRDHLSIGPSSMEWDGTSLSIAVDEVTMPLPSRIKGRITLTPSMLPNETIDLADGRHFWRAIAPGARVDVAFDRPEVAWSGSAYLDQNFGQAPLESGFRKWDWSRSSLPDGSSVVLYDMVKRGGERKSLAFQFMPNGAMLPIASPAMCQLGSTGWRVKRETRSDAETGARVLNTLEDTPFYARSLIASNLLGHSVTSVHESLSLERFEQRWVQRLLPFRMPRAPR